MTDHEQFLLQQYQDTLAAFEAASLALRDYRREHAEPRPPSMYERHGWRTLEDA